MTTTQQEIKNILIKLTDITGFDHSPIALEAFTQAESDLQSEIDRAVAERDREVVGIVGFVDEEFLAQPDAEEYVGEWAINTDRQRILQALISKEK